VWFIVYIQSCLILYTFGVCYSLYFWSLLFFILLLVRVCYATTAAGKSIATAAAGRGIATAAAGEVLLLLLLVRYTLAGAILPLNVN
jgi:hypothetical protein